MTQLSLQIPQINQPDSTEDAKIASNFTAIQNVINGGIDTTNLAAGVVDVRGAANIPTSESRTNTAYGTLATPDQVTGIVLPANGLIAVWYQATWKESVNNAANAAIYIGSNRLTTAAGSVVASIGGGVPGNDVSLSSFWLGLASQQDALAYGGDATTGQAVGISIAFGGPCYIFATAGTYTVSVQFKASSGSVTAKNRQLWVRALSFA